MSLEILDGEILLDGRVVAHVVDNLRYAIESELISAIDDYLDEDAREVLVRKARGDVVAEIACGDKEALNELAEARAIYRAYRNGGADPEANAQTKGDHP